MGSNFANSLASLSDVGAGAGGGSSALLGAAGGYLDNPIPMNTFRIRNDYESGINRFDRARFLFGTWEEGSFHPHAFVNNGQIKGTFFTPKATGPQINSDSIRMDILSAYAEWAPTCRFSVFAELPYRFVHFGPDIEEANSPIENSPQERSVFPEATEIRNPNTTPDGVSDVQFGFKYALIADTNQRYVTFQLRSSAPTGDPGLGLGLGCWTIEPSLLLYQRLTDRVVAQGQLSYWIPIAGGPGAGNVATYGAGISYDLIQRANFRLTPVFEAVGWTCIGGTEAVNGEGVVPGTSVPNPNVPQVTGIFFNGVFLPDDHAFKSATGDTIVNLKFGTRFYFGAHSDVYAGYGHCVTGDRWYKDIARVEYRYRF
jgi:hypothetical protein